MRKETEHGKGECLAACDDQINQVIVTSSMFLNHETFEKCEEFCDTLHNVIESSKWFKILQVSQMFRDLERWNW